MKKLNILRPLPFAIREMAKMMPFFVAMAVLARGPALAAGLNDTGITTYGNASSNTLTSEPTDYPGQDASFGRDAQAAAGTLAKVGAGHAGFDFTKIADNGNELPASATLGTGPNEWACTRDNVTGLTWEVKTDDGGLHDKDWTYTWYNSTGVNDGGSAGTAAGGSCGGTVAAGCDTEKFAAAVNAGGLCGATGWRLPTRKELCSIVDSSRYNPAIDTTYFPNTPSSVFWSSSPYANYSNFAWGFFFYHGYAYYGSKNSSNAFRLVRGGQ